MLQMNEHDPNRTIILHDNGFTMVSSHHLSQEHIVMFFQDNVNKSFTHRFEVEQVDHLLLDMLQEEGQ